MLLPNANIAVHLLPSAFHSERTMAAALCQRIVFLFVFAAQPHAQRFSLLNGLRCMRVIASARANETAVEMLRKSDDPLESKWHWSFQRNLPLGNVLCVLRRRKRAGRTSNLDRMRKIENTASSIASGLDHHLNGVNSAAARSAATGRRAQSKSSERRGARVAIQIVSRSAQQQRTRD